MKPEYEQLLSALLSVVPLGHFLETRLISPVGVVRQQFFPIDLLRSRGFRVLKGFLSRYSGKVNIYYGAAPRGQQRGIGPAVRCAAACWVDEIRVCASFLKEMPPSAVIETSPGKRQALWFLAEPTNDLDRIERLNKDLGRPRPSFRHGYAINFLNCSGRLDALQEQLGHKDINTTRIYLRLSDEDIRREVAKLEF